MVTIMIILALVPLALSTHRKVFRRPITKFESFVYGTAGIGFFATMVWCWTDHNGVLTVIAFAGSVYFLCAGLMILNDSHYSHMVKSHGIYDKQS